VYVSLPNTLHVDWTVRALEAGKHVLCEKPFSAHPDEVERAFAVAARERRLLMEGFMYRHLPLVARLLAVAGEGTIGQPRLVRAALRFRADPPNVALEPKLEGGALMAVGSYGIHVARAVLGEPERAYGESVLGPTGVDVVFAATLRHRAGALAQFDCGVVYGSYEQEIEVVGETGSLRLVDPWYGRGPLELRRSDVVERRWPEDGQPYRRQLEHFGAAARGEVEPLLTREDALAQVRVLDALRRSAGEGRPVELGV
jgi:predicted dehydrogenase